MPPIKTAAHDFEGYQTCTEKRGHDFVVNEDFSGAITITTDFSTEVEVRGGVREGDKVVLQPPVDLIDGDKVPTRSLESGGPTVGR
jgi:hypothetical protein